MYPAPVLTPYDHALALVLAVIFPLRAALFGLRRLRRAPVALQPRVRRRTYLEAIAVQWTATLAVLGLWVAQAREWDALGLRLHLTGGFAATGVAVAAAVAVLLAQLLAARRSDAAMERVAGRVRHLEAMLPHTAGELRLWWALALTAGICEETLFRGYLYAYAQHGMPAGVDPRWAFVPVSVVFGLGHLYQGWRGVLTTAGAGALFAIVYLVSGSLFLGMFAHAVVDLHAGHLTHAALARTSALAAERAREQAAALEAALAARPAPAETPP